MPQDLNIAADITPPTVEIDLAPALKGMPHFLAEIELFQRDSTDINFTITQNGQPLNLTGYTIYLQAKKAVKDTTFVINRTATITDAAKGKCRASLDGNDLATNQSLVAQLKLTQPGLTITAWQAPLIVTPSV